MKIISKEKGSACLQITGREKFIIKGTKCIISPLSNDADIYLNSLIPGEGDLVNPKKVATIEGNGKYTKIDGLLPNIEYYLDTNEIFNIKYFE